MYAMTKNSAGRKTTYIIANDADIPALTKYRFMDKGICRVSNDECWRDFLSNSVYNHVFWDAEDQRFICCTPNFDPDNRVVIYTNGVYEEIYRRPFNREELALLIFD